MRAVARRHRRLHRRRPRRLRARPGYPPPRGLRRMPGGLRRTRPGPGLAQPAGSHGGRTRTLPRRAAQPSGARCAPGGPPPCSPPPRPPDITFMPWIRQPGSGAAGGHVARHPVANKALAADGRRRPGRRGRRPQSQAGSGQIPGKGSMPEISSVAAQPVIPIPENRETHKPAPQARPPAGTDHQGHRPGSHPEQPRPGRAAHPVNPRAWPAPTLARSCSSPGCSCRDHSPGWRCRFRQALWCPGPAGRFHLACPPSSDVACWLAS